MKKTILAILLINNAFAQNAVKLNKGDITPFTGVLVKESKLIELDKAQRQNIVLKDLRFTQDELITYHKDKAIEARTELNKAQFKGYIGIIGAFVIGAIITSFTFKINEKVGDI